MVCLEEEEDCMLSEAACYQSKEAKPRLGTFPAGKIDVQCPHAQRITSFLSGDGAADTFMSYLFVRECVSVCVSVSGTAGMTEHGRHCFLLQATNHSKNHSHIDHQLSGITITQQHLSS